MSTGLVGLIAGLLLAGVFTAAGIAKLGDLRGTRFAVREFGAPIALVRPLAIGLPLAELAVAALLLYGPTRAVGGAGGLALLAVFAAAITVSLARGRAPDCHCFGQLHSAPASRRTLGRNGVLAGLAVAPLYAGVTGETPSAFAWAGTAGTAEILAVAAGAVAVALLSGGVLAFLSLTRSYGSVLLRLERMELRLAEAGIDVDEHDAPQELGLEPGTSAPAFVAIDTTEGEVSLDDLLAPGLPLLLLFTSSSCGPCSALLPSVAAWQAEHAQELTIAIANGSDSETSRAEAAEHGLEHMLVDESLALFEAFEANSTPNAVLVAADGTIASWAAAGADAIEQLLTAVLTAAPETEEQGLPVGSPAPEVELVGLDGDPLLLSRLAGEETLLLFWNPGCGFCSSMRDEVLAWEQSAPAGAPRLLIVSSGDEAATRAEGFSSVVALDPEFAAGDAFDAGGTPMAVLIDRNGRIGSPVVAGAEGVFALAGARTSSPSLEDAMEQAR